MTSSEGTAWPTAAALATAIRQKDVSPVELVDGVLERIAERNGTLRAFLTVGASEARSLAQAAERRVCSGEEIPPLLGVPIGIKDLQDTAGMRTTYGSVLFREHIPTSDTIAVGRLRAAGAIVIGKTNCPEFGLLGETRNLLGDEAVNPWDSERTCGGSSGGSAAAVSAGLTPIALGDDGAGSVVAPAAMCGVLGMKATRGRVPLGPEPAQTFLYTDVGALGPAVDDIALMVEVMSGPDRCDPLSLRNADSPLLADSRREPAGLRVACTQDFGHFPTDPEIAEATRTAALRLESLGCHVEEQTPHVPNPWPIYEPLFWADTWTLLGELFEGNPDGFLPESREEIAPGRDVTQVQLVRSLDALWRFRWELDDFFQRFDILIMPTTATSAFPVGRPPDMIGGTRVRPYWTTFMPFPVVANMCGLPEVSVPWGQSRAGVPIGILVLAQRGGDPTVLAVARALTNDEPVRHPSIVGDRGDDQARWV